jgi:hypothetical protein
MFAENPDSLGQVRPALFGGRGTSGRRAIQRYPERHVSVSHPCHYAVTIVLGIGRTADPRTHPAPAGCMIPDRLPLVKDGSLSLLGKRRQP